MNRVPDREQQPDRTDDGIRRHSEEVPLRSVPQEQPPPQRERQDD